MSESTTGQADYVPQPIEIELDESRLLEGTCKPILYTAFVTIFLSCIAIHVATNQYASIFESFLAGIASSFCSSIGLAIPAFLGWGISVFLGSRLNSILGKPLNPSAVAALASGNGFGFAHTVAYAGFASDPGLGNATTTSIFAAVAVLGSLLFQTVARVRVKREIARHNARAARKRYVEPPCDVRFQIRQMMKLMVAVSLFLAIAMRLEGDGSLILLFALWGILTATTFYPAILLCEWVDQKLGSVKLKPWEVPKAESEILATPSAPIAQLVDQDGSLDPIPNYRSAARFTAFDAMSSAIRCIGFAGGVFGLLFVIFVEVSKATYQTSIGWGGIFLALPTVLGGLMLGSMLAAFIMMFLGMVNFVTGDRIRTGTLAALTGGLVGSIGSWLLLCGFEIVHFVPWNGALDFSTPSNQFPLAIVLLGSLMGQASGRLGVKTCGFQSGLTHEDYQSESTSPVLSRFTIVVLLLSVSAWIVVFAHNEGSRMHAVEDHFTTMVVGAFASTFLVWPLANFLARAVRIAPKRSPKPVLSFNALRQRQA